MNKKTFYITTPIFYPNGPAHMGHAYTTILADILKRYHYQKGEETYLLTGTDEHTTKVIDAAKKENKDPKQFTDDVVVGFKNFYASVNVGYDQFIRTSDREVHWPGAQEFWKKLQTAGDIYKGLYKGLYCVGCEAFITEKDLVDGKCPLHNQEPQKIEEENYFFKLSKYTQIIKEKIEKDELWIVPISRRNEILSLLETGLEDVSFSRPTKAIPWGIPVPGDDSQTIYVWCDALINYISALGFGRADDSLYKKFWDISKDQGISMHAIGKDILRFHAAIWPAMLLSAGLPLPQQILVHGMLLSGGKKMSKTLGNTIDPVELVNEFGGDALRYYIGREVSPFDDGDITPEKFKESYNANLANGLGNLLSRTIKMSTDYFAGVVSNGNEALGAFNFFNLGKKNTVDDFFTYTIKVEFDLRMEAFEVNQAFGVVWDFISALDKYIAETKPFKVVKEDEHLARGIIYNVLSGLFRISDLIEPLMPQTSKIIKEYLGSQHPRPNSFNTRPLEKSLFPRKD